MRQKKKMDNRKKIFLTRKEEVMISILLPLLLLFSFTLLLVPFACFCTATSTDTDTDAANYTTISPHDAKSLITAEGGNLVILDIREAEEYEVGHVKRAVWRGTLISFDKYRDKKILVYDNNDTKSREFCNYLASEDLNMEIYNLEGGLDAWKEAGFETVPVPTPPIPSFTAPSQPQTPTAVPTATFPPTPAPTTSPQARIPGFDALFALIASSCIIIFRNRVRRKKK
jgi:rhodanese-related sulfurtransferase